MRQHAGKEGAFRVPRAETNGVKPERVGKEDTRAEKCLTRQSPLKAILTAPKVPMDDRKNQ